MRTNRILIVLTIILFSCNKNENNSSNSVPEDINAKLQGKWYLSSETRSGSYDNSIYKGLPSDNIEYKADGKAYSQLQGQYGLFYDYNLNTTNRTILFQYISTHPQFITTQPCSSSPGCLRLAKVKLISDRLLVLDNTFRDTTNGIISTMTIIDSLSK